MNKVLFSLATAAAGIALSTGSAMAQDKSGANEADKAGSVTAEGTSVEQLTLAAELAAYGRETGNAMALLVAGQIVSNAPVVETARKKTSEAEAGAETEEKGEEADPVTAASLFAEAGELAGSDEALQARIERASTSARASKGRVGGAADHTDRVNAHASDWYTITFRGGERARVGVIGDGDTDLDLYVYDENENQICSDTDGTDTMYCSWTPRWTGAFRVKIKNYGSVYNRYRLITN